MRDARYFEGMLSTVEAARVLGIRPRTLELWRAQGKGPTYARIGRACRYSKGALQKFIEENERLSSSDVAEMTELFKTLSHGMR